MPRSSIALPRALYDELDRIAALRMSTRSGLIREAILEWLRRQEAAAAVQ